MNTDSRRKILDSIRTNRPSGSFSYPVVRDLSVPTPGNTGLEDFKVHLKEAYANWYEVKDDREALGLIRRLHPQEDIICSATPEIPGTRALSPSDDPHSLEDVGVGVVRASFGVAENGAVWISEDDLVVNALGFLSQHLIVLLDPAKIVTNMHAAYKKVTIDQHNYGCFVMGPSATADIDATLVKGAQGVRSLNVLFLKDPRE